MSCCITAQLPTPLVLPLGVAECEPPVVSDYSFAAGLYTYLTENAELFCLIADRVFPRYVPRHVEQAEYPCIVYKISRTPVDACTGQSGSLHANVDLECWAPDPDDADRVAEAVRRAMQGFGPGWFGLVPVVRSLLEADEEDAEEPKDDSQTWWHVRTLTFDVQYLVPVHGF